MTTVTCLYRGIAIVSTLLSISPTVQAAMETPITTAGVTPSGAELQVREEPDDQGTRIRVSTAEVAIVTTADRSLAFRLECIHPTGTRTKPSQCIVYLVSSSPEWRYKEHETPFTVSLNGESAFQHPFKSFKVVREGSKVIEPLVSFWSWDRVLAVAQAKDVVFTLAGERIAVPEDVAAGARKLVAYFEKGV